MLRVDGRGYRISDVDEAVVVSMERDVASVVRACSDHREGDRICMQRLMCERVSKFFETSKKNSGRGNRLVKVLDGRKGVHPDSLDDQRRASRSS